MPYRQTAVSGFPAVALRSAELELVVVPAIGMKLTHLRRLRGREWLWRNDQLPLGLPKPGASFVETADSGGWDECFPTVGPSPLPGAPAGTPPLPDHGELWSADWTSSVADQAEGTSLTSVARGTRLPYEFQRELTVASDGPVVRLQYRLRHTGGAPFPWIWSAHPLFNVQPGTTLRLPGLEQVKLDQVHGRDDLARNDIVSWPGAIGRSAETFTFPEPAVNGWAVKLFGDLTGEGRMVLTDPRAGERLELTARPAEVPQVGLWLNCAGWAPPGRRPYYNLGLEPCIGAPDRLEDAVASWGTAPVLEPGGERRWSLELVLPEPD
jgi:galactose mutarotase-like enzyme